MNDILKRLLTPEGVRDLLPDMAGKKRKLEGMIQDIFNRFGYREVSTPAFEYSANFVAEMKSDLEDNIYRFLDERGRTLVLRPDFTLPMARVAAMHLSGEPKPLRLCYGGDIFRYASGLQGKQRELTQAGVELIGDASPGSDAEIIALAASVLQAAGLEDFTLCLGHVGYLDILLSAYGVAAEDSEQIKHYFNKKDFVSLAQLVAKLPVSDQAKTSIMRVPSLRGGASVLVEAFDLLPEGADPAPLLTLASIWSVLEDYDLTCFITLDLGMVRMMNYYTGMVFEGYTGGLGYPLCGGGRYDQLLVKFGPDLPAVGFAVSLDQLLTVLERQKRLPELLEPIFIGYGEGGRAAAIAAALTLREQGAVIITDVQAATFAAAKTTGKNFGASRLLYYTEDSLQDADLQDEEEM